MLTEIFQKPKPILATLQLLPLPGSQSWLPNQEGALEAVLTRLEQEAYALASARVDGIVLENTYDFPFNQPRLDPAGVAALTLLSQKAAEITQLPIGLSVLPNDPETAMAIALIVSARWIRVPVALGSRLTAHGFEEGKLQALMTYQKRLHPHKSLPLFADLSLNHQLPRHASGKSFSALEQLIDGAHALEKTGLLHGLILPGDLLDTKEVALLKEQIHLPLILEDPVCPRNLSSLYDTCDGFLLTQSIKKPSISGFSTHPSLDFHQLEEKVQQARDIRIEFPFESSCSS